MSGAYELIYPEAVDFRQSYQLIDCQFVFIAFQAFEPTGGELIGGVAPFPSHAATTLLNLSQ